MSEIFSARNLRLQKYLLLGCKLSKLRDGARKFSVNFEHKIMEKTDA